MGNFSIIAESLIKRYAQAKENAVDGIDLSVKEGEIYGFLGPNGAGKSTTIKILVTTLFPTTGTVTVCGFDTVKQSTQVRQNIGVVYQNASLDNNLTAEENLRSHAVLYGITPFSLTYNGTSSEYKKKVDMLLELVHLEKHKFDIVKTFSGGMRRKLDILKAMLHTPKVLFLDEPTTGLDPQSRRTVWNYLETMQKKEGFTIFLTTQYLEEAEICDRISIIDKGKLLVTDTPEKLKKSVGEEMLYIKPASTSKLEDELQRKGIPFTNDTMGHFVIDLQKERAQDLLKKINTDLEEINIKKPSLDDVFIKFTGRQIV